MEKLITLAQFHNTTDIKYSLLKSMLDQAEIKYIIVNENARNVEPFVITPSNLSIEIKIYDSDIEIAFEILKSIS